MDCSMPGFPVLPHLLEIAQIHVHQVSDVIQPSHPLSSPFPPAFNLSQHHGLISNESALCIRWTKYWSFSFSISPSNEHSWLISCKIDWFDLLAVQGTLESLLQHHSLKASFVRLLAFFMVQLSHPSMTTGDTWEKAIWYKHFREALQSHMKLQVWGLKMMLSILWELVWEGESQVKDSNIWSSGWNQDTFSHRTFPLPSCPH